MLQLFRRKKRQKDAPVEGAAQPEPVAVATPPAATSVGDPSKPKRRRGNRGGRGRKKKADAPATAETKPLKKEAKKASAKKEDG